MWASCSSAATGTSAGPGGPRPWALRAALLGTGPGVIAGGLATATAFLACIAAPFPGFRDLGLTAGLGLLACMASSFLVLPALLLGLDRGKGTFAPVRRARPAPAPGSRPGSPWRRWRWSWRPWASAA